ncbi:MAG: hypothetical protein WA418_37200 [Bradyrhizobium sp.]
MFGIVDTLLDGVRCGRDAYVPVLAAIVTYATERFHCGEQPWPSGLLTYEEIDGLMLGNAGKRRPAPRVKRDPEGQGNNCLQTNTSEQLGLSPILVGKAIPPAA